MICAWKVPECRPTHQLERLTEAFNDFIQWRQGNLWSVSQSRPWLLSSRRLPNHYSPVFIYVLIGPNYLCFFSTWYTRSQSKPLRCNNPSNIRWKHKLSVYTRAYQDHDHIIHYSLLMQLQTACIHYSYTSHHIALKRWTNITRINDTFMHWSDALTSHSIKLSTGVKPQQ
jgi:hypothetical protein